MVWFRVDDNLSMHVKAVTAGNSALGLWVRAGSWCARHLTDGHVPTAIATSLGTKREIAALIRAGLWVETEGGYEFHEWGAWQPSEAEVRSKRAKTADRVAKWRARNSEGNGVTETVTNGASNGVRTPAPSPSPSPSPSVVKSRSRLTQGDAHQNDDDRKINNAVVAALKAATGRTVDEAWAARVQRQLLANREVQNPVAYVTAAIREDPDRYVPTPSPPNFADLNLFGTPE